MSRPSLDYLRSSPVRGQLEPHHPTTEKGWRYIQTTDTLDELKVLLPPVTAAMYEQLLKFENYELSKKSSISWERILEIRHLKDRMIRKCQKLSKSIRPATTRHPRGEGFAFQTFIAPSDFRVKEMEKWFKDQQKRVTAAVVRRPSLPVENVALRDSYCCIHSDAHPPSKQHHSDVPITNISSQSSRLNSKQTTYPSLYPKADPRPKTSQYIKLDRSITLPAKATSSSLPTIPSPKPLPILLRAQREGYGLEPTDDIESVEQEPLHAGVALEPTIATPQDIVVSVPELRRQRSCIKRTSIDISKTVSWADDQGENQLTKYNALIANAQAAGKWKELRALYMEQLHGLESLQSQVMEGLENLRSETEHLLRIDNTLRSQRETLRDSLQEFEQKQALLQDKVQQVLEEAEDSIPLYNVEEGPNPVEAE